MRFSSPLLQVRVALAWHWRKCACVCATTAHFSGSYATITYHDLQMIKCTRRSTLFPRACVCFQCNTSTLRWRSTVQTIIIFPEGKKHTFKLYNTADTLARPRKKWKDNSASANNKGCTELQMQSQRNILEQGYTVKRNGTYQNHFDCQ